MRTARLTMTSPLMLLLALAATAQTRDVPGSPEDGGPRDWKVTGVARAGGGYATVAIKCPTGPGRAIFIRMGRPIGADTSQSDGDLESRATKESDLPIIRIGNERYEIPDAVILGG